MCAHAQGGVGLMSLTQFPLSIQDEKTEAPSCLLDKFPAQIATRLVTGHQRNQRGLFRAVGVRF